MPKKFLFWIIILPLFFLTRTVNLLAVPIFTDEAIYAYWAQVALHDPANRFISLIDGKQPLFIWLAAILQKFIADPLVAARLVSVFSGFAAIIGIYLLSNSLFNSKVAKVAAIFYLILPFTLLYDRLALFDSLLAMLGIFSAYFSVRLIKKPMLDNAMLNGFAMGFALITKSSAAFFLLMAPFSVLLFDFKSKKRLLNLSKWLVLLLVSVILAQLIYNSLRLSELFYIIGQKNLEFIRPLDEVLKKPFLFAIPNALAIKSWLISYLGLPLFLLFILGALLGILKRDQRIILLLGYVLAPFIAELLFNKVLYPRFVLFFFPYIIVIAAFSTVFVLQKLPTKKYYTAAIFFLIISAFPAFTSFVLLTNPAKANIPSSDSNQYLNSWPSGAGVKEITELIKGDSQNQKIHVATEGTFGLLPFALQIYFFGNPNVTISGYWPVNTQNLPQQVLEKAKEEKTYFVFNENQKEIQNNKLKIVSKYQKGVGNSYMRLFEVIPQ